MQVVFTSLAPDPIARVVAVLHLIIVENVTAVCMDRGPLLGILICWCVLLTCVRSRRPEQPITSQRRLLCSPVQESTWD